MAEKGPNEQMLSLLREIDAKLTKIQIGIAKDKIAFRLGEFSVRGFLTNVLTLALQINIAIWGYRYITTAPNEDIPPIAIIGTIGIAFVVINSILKVINDSYSLFLAWKKAKRIVRSLAYLMPPLERLKNEFDPNKISKENIEEILRLKSISDDLLRRFIEIGDGDKTIDEFIDELEKASSSLKNVPPIEQNP